MRSGPETWRDPAVPELDQVLDGGLDAGGVVDADGRPERLVEGGPDDDGRQSELGEQRGPLVVDGQVGDQDAVDAALGGEPAVRRLVVALGDLEQQRVAVLGEHRLQAGDERGEERVGAQRLGRPGHDQADGERLRHRQRAAAGARGPAQLAGHLEDPGPGGRGDAGTVVQRERDRALRHARGAGDVVDRGAGHADHLNRFS